MSPPLGLLRKGTPGVPEIHVPVRGRFVTFGLYFPRIKVSLNSMESRAQRRGDLMDF
jgi:hypothetical protein